MKFIVPFIFALALAGCESDLTSKKDQMTALAAIENGALLVDVRSAKEVSTGSFDNAINIPHTDIVAGLEKLGQGCAGGSGLSHGDQWRGLQRPASR